MGHRHGMGGSRLAAVTAMMGIVALGSSSVEASGSVALEVVGARCGVMMQQTFRKILRRGQAKGYYQRVRERFAARLAPLVVRVDQTLRKTKMGRRVPSRGYDLRLPRVLCPRRGPCAPAQLQRKRYPAVLVLPEVKAKASGRYVYRLAVALRRPPTKKVLSALQATLQRLVNGPAAGSPTPPPKTAQVASLAHEQRLVMTTITTRQRVLVGFERRHRRQLEALAKAASKTLRAHQRKAHKGLRFGPVSPRLPYLDDAKPRFPGRWGVSVYDPRFHLHLQWAYLAGASEPRRLFAGKLRAAVVALFGGER